MRGSKLRQHAGAQRIAPADVQQGFVRAEKAVHPRRLGQLIGQFGRQVIGQFRDGEHALHRRVEHRLRHLAPQFAPEIAQHARIAQGTMPSAAAESVPLHHRIQIVARVFWKQASRQLDGAEDLGRERPVEPAKLAA